MADQPVNNRFEFDRLRLELSRNDEEKDKLSAEFLKKTQGEDAGGIKPKITDVDEAAEQPVADQAPQPPAEEAGEDIPAPAPVEPKRSFWSRMLTASPEAKKKQQEQRRSEEARMLVEKLESTRLEQERQAEALSQAILTKAGSYEPPLPEPKPANTLFEKQEPQEPHDFGLNKPKPATSEDNEPQAISSGVPDPITRPADNKEPASAQAIAADMGMGQRISFGGVSDNEPAAPGAQKGDEEARQKLKEEEKKEYRRQSEEAFEKLQVHHKERQDGFEEARNLKKRQREEATAIEMEKQAVERKEWAREAKEAELAKKDNEAVDAFRLERAEMERINLQSQETREMESRRQFEETSSNPGTASGGWVSSLFPTSFGSGGSGSDDRSRDHYSHDKDAYPGAYPLADERDTYRAHDDNRGGDNSQNQGGGGSGSWVSSLFGGRNDDLPPSYGSQDHHSRDDHSQIERERREFDERRQADTQRNQPFVSSLFGPRDEPPVANSHNSHNSYNSYDALPLPAVEDRSVSNPSSSSGSSGTFGSLFGFNNGGDDRSTPPPVQDDYLNNLNSLPSREYSSHDSYSGGGGSSGSDWHAQQAQQHDSSRREAEAAAREAQRQEAERMRTEMEQFRSFREEQPSHHSQNNHSSHNSYNNDNNYNNHHSGANNTHHHSELPSHYRPPDPPPYGS